MGLLGSFAFATQSCDGRSSDSGSVGVTQPPTPNPGTPSPTVPSPVTVSGTVFELTPLATVPGANVALLVRSGLGAQPWLFFATTSDNAGRYSVSGVPAGGISIAAAPGSGYYTPCPAGWDVVRVDRSFDVYVVSGALLPTLPLGGVPTSNSSIWVSGNVYESTSTGTRPVAGATVRLTDDDSDPRVGSTTLTDAVGRYLLCPPIPSTGTDVVIPVRVSKEGYAPTSRPVVLGWDYSGVDIELTRK